MAAQNQHYVPKFILRQFLADEENERVNVYDKHKDQTFVTSIKNVMAERRFNDFKFGDNWTASFEPIACAAEDQVLPAYREVVQQRRLSDDPEQKAALAVLIAFQFLRTKAHRDRWQSLEEETVKMVEAAGGRMQDVQGWEGWEPSTEDTLKREHIGAIRGSLQEFAQIIVSKDFVLAEPAPGRSFYLGDNPVSLANARDFEPYGNLGIAVPGIEIYMPLAADLMLCAWCPSILADIRERHDDGKRQRRAELLRQVVAGQMSPAEMKQLLEQFEPLERTHEELLRVTAEGRPVSSSSENMDYYNGLQTTWAYRYVISRDGDFSLAERANRENPQLRRGRRLRAN